MDLATGAMGSLLSKLVELSKDEYRLQKGVKKSVESLSRELMSMQAALRKVGEVPPDELDPLVKIWAREIKELSYNMEDVIDIFQVHVDGAEPSANNKEIFKGLMKKMFKLFKKGKKRHKIADAIKEISENIQEVVDRRGKYTVDTVVAKPIATTPIDPRLRALYTEVTELVGINGKRDQELIRLLSEEEDESKKKLKVVSVVGFGGLGKTTLVRAVYEKLNKEGFDYSAFVPVGRNVDVKKVLRDIILDLNMYEQQLTILDERQLINKLRKILEDRKYLIVIDDMWDEQMWRVIKCAFPDRNNNGSRIITTTRKVNISKACCPSGDGIYEMKPLSNDDSKRLFYKRLLSDCPHKFEQDILKKCGGIPLAIITIASILASGQRDWPTLVKSIGSGLTEDASVEEMHRVLSFSYYDLPSHLKTCLLYLCIFPEDCEIERDQLIWRWIAENFIQLGEKETSLSRVGEAYFNELINRGMLQPVYNQKGGVEVCRVHDMVLDLIRSLSSEENFVTIFDGIMDNKSSESKIRRLSLQARKEDHQTRDLDSMGISHVRSITVFEPAIGIMSHLPYFVVLRVLVLSGCQVGEMSLKDLGELFHLRYLGLADTDISDLPAEIGKLQLLQVLDVRDNRNLKQLPSSVCKLRRLMCLQIDHAMRFQDGLGNMESIEVLKEIDGTSLNIVQELGKLKKLKELKIKFERNTSLEMEEAFVNSIGNLRGIQILVITGSFRSMDLLGECMADHGNLRIFESVKIGKFSTLPAWIQGDGSPLSKLSELRIDVKELQQEDLRILGQLPALRSLQIKSIKQTEKLRIDGFRCTRDFFLFCLFPLPVIFQRGALPMAEVVHITLGVQIEEDNGNGDIDKSLARLPSLQEVNAAIHCHGITVGEAKEVEGKLMKALDGHRNQPSFKIDIQPPIPEDAEDEDIME